MTAARPLPEIRLSGSLSSAIAATAGALGSIDSAERRALAEDVSEPLEASPEWLPFRERTERLVRECGYAIIRGAEADEGRSLLLVASMMGSSYATYGAGRIVKRFRMSPWTKELSHTLRAGNFHTDGNVSAVPPIATAMQCETEDPGGDDYAELRVAHLPQLLGRLEQAGAGGRAAIAFLTEEEQSMAHSRSAAKWRGRLVDGDLIRYHPESLRVASDRAGGSPEHLERMIATVHRAALEASAPFHIGAGDILFVSNRRALHYRGECSVRFTRFPTEFEARSLLLLHRMGSIA